MIETDFGMAWKLFFAFVLAVLLGLCLPPGIALAQPHEGASPDPLLPEHATPERLGATLGYLAARERAARAPRAVIGALAGGVYTAGGAVLLARVGGATANPVGFGLALGLLVAGVLNVAAAVASALGRGPMELLAVAFRRELAEGAPRAAERVLGRWVREAREARRLRRLASGLSLFTAVVALLVAALLLFCPGGALGVGPGEQLVFGAFGLLAAGGLGAAGAQSLASSAEREARATP